MGHSQGMFKSRMICIDIGVFRRAQLFEFAKALQLWRVEYFDCEGAEANGFVDGVVGVQTSWFFEGAEGELRHRVVVCVGRCFAGDHRIRKRQEPLHYRTAQGAMVLLVRQIMLETAASCRLHSSFLSAEVKIRMVLNGGLWWLSRYDSRPIRAKREIRIMRLKKMSAHSTETFLASKPTGYFSGTVYFCTRFYSRKTISNLM